MPGRRGSQCCCGGSCFAPCDCFAKKCELELTIGGWEDNPSTDCGGIANRTFNGTHNVTGLNVTSSSPYGFSCDFTLTWDDLVLTKLVGGSCICKAQPALYTLNGTLQCGGSPGDFIYSLLLEFRVPVYDEDQGCSPSPCTVEAEWETWTTQIELYRGPMSGNPICNTDIDLQAINWTTTGSAQTTCGLGLDGTDATIAIRFVLCDPEGDTLTGCETCCSEDVDAIPDRVQVVLDGLTGSLFPFFCDCPDYNGTFVLERISGQCAWQYQWETAPCDDEPLPFGDRPHAIVLSVNPASDPNLADPETCMVFLNVVGFYEHLAFLCDSGQLFLNGVKCSEWDGEVLTECSAYWQGDVARCDYSSATATITALP